MSIKQNTKGFTIIEVVLVLAIAGLIFLMVFVALPALQGGQRDTARKQDVGNLGTAINNYSSANRGKLPSSASVLGTISTTGDNTGYLGSISNNITGIQVNAGAANFTPEDGVLYVRTGTKCATGASATAASVVKGTPRQYTIVTLLEGGGGSAYCQDF